MFKHYFEQIAGIDIWPIISLSIFFSFFTILIIWVVRTKKSEMDEMSKMPLDDQLNDFNNN